MSAQRLLLVLTHVLVCLCMTLIASNTSDDPDEGQCEIEREGMKKEVCKTNSSYRVVYHHNTFRLVESFYYHVIMSVAQGLRLIKTYCCH